MADYEGASATVYGEHQKVDILRQLDRLLDNPYFSHSKRFPSFLRFIVQEELEGRGDQLKERTLGIEVFGRHSGYDTTSDPIVRVTAAEIRKRIAQYYQNTESPDELRISLLPGSYIPHFEWPCADSIAPAAPSTELPFAPPLNGSPHAPSGQEAIAGDLPLYTAHWRFHAWWLVLVGVLLCASLVGSWLWVDSRPTTLDQFWAPVFGSTDPISLCFPQSPFSGQTLLDASAPNQQQHLDEQMRGVVLDDLQPLMSLSGLLEMRRRHYTLLGEDTATLSDLRNGPTIFLGAFDNTWTLRMTRDLRYRFGNDPGMTHFWIEDTQSHEQLRWSVDRQVQQTTHSYRDYAIVARFRDANTGKLAVVAAGIARGGTVAAGEFLTQPGEMDAIKAHAPKGWNGKNMEFVLSTEIIDGSSSPPKIVAMYFW
ncbi:hypothetical protein [Granulicella sp. L46]|uniref:hypothetical protein n=1 Tax=Granulicella sp. L46 TaxID=1641865 RepID=UPI00131ECE0B|nr:hypothetical protein [Granulicella sp. L46]